MFGSKAELQEKISDLEAENKRYRKSLQGYYVIEEEAKKEEVKREIKIGQRVVYTGVTMTCWGYSDCVERPDGECELGAVFEYYKENEGFCKKWLTLSIIKTLKKDLTCHNE